MFQDKFNIPLSLLKLFSGLGLREHRGCCSNSALTSSGISTQAAYWGFPTSGRPPFGCKKSDEGPQSGLVLNVFGDPGSLRGVFGV